MSEEMLSRKQVNDLASSLLQPIMADLDRILSLVVDLVTLREYVAEGSEVLFEDLDVEGDGEAYRLRLLRAHEGLVAEIESVAKHSALYEYYDWDNTEYVEQAVTRIEERYAPEGASS